MSWLGLGGFALTRRGFVGASALAAFGLARPAGAYILPGDAILGDAAGRRAALGFRTLSLSGARYRGPNDLEPAKVTEILTVSGAHRIEIASKAGTDVVLAVDRRRYEFRLGEAPGKPLRSRRSWAQIFFANPEPGARAGLEFCEAHGVDFRQVRLALFADRVAYVLGGKEPEQGRLWIDKEALVPIRVETAEKSERTDVRLLGFGSAQTREWYPRRVETHKNGTLVEVTVYDRVLVDEKIDDALLKAPTA